MSKVVLQFSSLQDLAECLYQLNIRRPELDYDQFTLSAELTAEQVERAKDFRARVLRPDSADQQPGA